MTKRWKIAIAVAVVLVLIFGWPTLYRYEHLSNGVLVRINRITGDTWSLHGVRWYHAGNPATRPD